MRVAKFSMDPFAEKVFDGLASGETWNGWACPYFNLEQAGVLLKHINPLA